MFLTWGTLGEGVTSGWPSTDSRFTLWGVSAHVVSDHLLTLGHVPGSRPKSRRWKESVEGVNETDLL